MRDENLYLKLLQSLLPIGKAWTRRLNSDLTKVLSGFSVEFSRIDSRADDIFNESIPSRINELLEEWENEFGIQDEEIGIELTFEKRVAVIKAKFSKLGQQNEQYYKDLADTLGWNIRIEIYMPAISGFSQSGTATCGDRDVLFYWKVYIVIEDGMDYNIKRLIYEFQQNNQAHTIVLFDFYGSEFDRSFSIDFDRIQYYDGSWYSEFSFGREFSNAFANAFDYDGENYIGAFSNAFEISFDNYSGGSFSDSFDNNFELQH